MKIKVSPLFFALALALVAFGHALDFVWTMLALFIHETAHALVARSRGFVVKKLVLLPYGAMMSAGESFDKTSSILIGVAGPVANILSALVLLGVWWLFPVCYAYTEKFFYCNLSLGLFNLLPIYPLDGSRMLLGASKNKLRALKGMQIAGVCVSFAFLAAFIASFFFGLNFSFGIMAVFLFYGATFGTKEESYVSVLDSASKNYMLGVVKKRVQISQNAPLLRFYHHVGVASDTIFDVVDDDEKVVKTIDERGLKTLALKNKLTTPMKDCKNG